MDLAIFTYYIDPVWEMPVYIYFLSIHLFFDTDREPEGNWLQRLGYSWAEFWIFLN